MTLTTTVAACGHCGQPATYRHVEDDITRCEGCAIRYGYEQRGEQYIAMKTLGFAVSLLQQAGIGDDAIRGMLNVVLTDPHSTGSYAVGGDQFLPGPDDLASRPWTAGQELLATNREVA